MTHAKLHWVNITSPQKRLDSTELPPCSCLTLSDTRATVSDVKSSASRRSSAEWNADRRGQTGGQASASEGGGPEQNLAPTYTIILPTFIQKQRLATKYQPRSQSQAMTTSPVILLNCSSESFHTVSNTPFSLNPAKTSLTLTPAPSPF